MNRQRKTIGCIALVLAGAFSGEAADSFDRCESELAAAPESREAAACFYQVASELQLLEDGARRLEPLRTAHPENPWLPYYLAQIEWSTRADKADRVEELFREAARGFEAQGEPRGEFVVRYNLRLLLSARGELDKASLEVERAVRLAQASPDTSLRVRALLLEGGQLIDTGQDLGHAYRLFLRAEKLALAEGDDALLSSVLFELGDVCHAMGRFEEALSYYRRNEAITREAGDGYAAASLQFNIANTLLAQMEELPREGGRDEVIAAAGEALRRSMASGNRHAEVITRRLLGYLLGSVESGREEARNHLELCAQGAKEIASPAYRVSCLSALGSHLAATGEPGALEKVVQALALDAELGSNLSTPDAMRQLMRVRWMTDSREHAIRDSLAALEAIEALRDAQPDAIGSTGVFSAWTKDYYQLSGRLLDGGQTPASRDDLALAFSITERLRARMLLDQLTRARRDRKLPRSHPLAQKLQETLESIVSVHRRLLRPDLPGDQRQLAMTALEDLELEEAETRMQISELDGAPPETPAPAFTTLDQIESSLAENEALLSFQIGLWRNVYEEFGGGAFVLVVTRRGTQAFRLPDRVRLEGAVSLFQGLFDRRDASLLPPSVMLYREVMEEALQSLPAGIDKLVLIPDGSLHRMPFAALRAGEEAEPLAVRFHLSVAPSATLWLRWRQRLPTSPSTPALALADPVLSGAAGEEAAAERSWLLAGDVRLGALPYARREGRALIRHLGGGSQLLVGEEATEHTIKTMDLTRFGLLHFAAHAVVDEANPERSSILLAPGDASEDGLLQMREVAELALDGQVVVLSACRSASGAVLRGEGVLGLARAFFQAGAHTVVGSLWPLRDDEAAVLFDAFYRHLGAGESLGEALQAAQREGIRSGLPEAAWAGLVVLGDDRLRFPAEAATSRSRRALPVFGVVLVGVLALWTLLRRRRTKG